MSTLLRKMVRLFLRYFRPRVNPGAIAWGTLRRLRPISSTFGFDRGTPVDRYYIEEFLQANSADIQGRVLEIGDGTYARRFGGTRIDHLDVLHAAPGNTEATIVGNLETGEQIPRNRFDCVILTQTLLCVFDVRSAVHHCHETLRPGGVLLVTVPGISQISRYDMDRWGDYWRFTTLSMERLFRGEFAAQNVAVEAKGNVLTAIAFLHGAAAEELSREELDYSDPDYQVLITVKARKRGVTDNNS